MTPLDSLDAKVRQLIEGWHETREYTNAHGEIRVDRIFQPPLLVQLWNMTEPLKTGPASGSSGNKPESRPPGSLEAANLIHEIRGYARTLRAEWSKVPVLPRPIAGELRGLLIWASSRDDDELEDANRAIAAFIRRAKLMLGHEAPKRMLAESVCGDCGGGLQVADDASSSVRCVGYPDQPGCGNEYPPYMWLELALNEAGDN